MSRYIFDIETNGFLDTLDRIHSLCMVDIETGEEFSYHGNISEGCDKLLAADQIIGHNIIKFDIPALEMVYGCEFDRSKVLDTFVLSKLYFSNVKDWDLKQPTGRFPMKLFGQQSLKAWGWRLGDYKGDFEGPWDTWTQEMQTYCEQDVRVTHRLFKRIRKEERWPVAEQLEHDAAWLCAQIERNGFAFNEDAATTLYGELCQKREELASSLKTLFPPWVVYKGEVVSKANNAKHGHTIGAVYSKIELRDFNPLSRDHIADRLKVKYGWMPTEFTDGKKPKPKIDESILSGLTYPEAKPLAELFLIEKRIGQIAEGTEAWMKHVKDGLIRHSINPNGAVTGRATHSHPNMTQVPRVTSRYGKECRSLFGVKPGWLMVGIDVAGLELRCLAHYMAHWDGGEYGKTVVLGKEADGTDVHSVNTRAIGLEPRGSYTINGKSQSGRNCAKTFIYAFLYGAGPEKIGNTIGVTKTRGAGVINDFLDRTPALKKLRDYIQKKAKSLGWLLALDGRHMHCRSQHSALNTLLQGAGAIICKAWIVEVDRILRAQGLKHGWDGDYAFLIWAHDELQIATLPDLADTVEAAGNEAIGIVQKQFGIRLPLAVSAQRGLTWAECH